MGVWHGPSRRLPSGGLRTALRARGKRKREMGREFVPTILSDREERKTIRVMGGNTKVRLRRVVYANVADPKTGTVRKAKILSLLENKAHRHFIRANVITKGAIIETEIGKAVVTSRPNQDGVVNARLIE